MFILKRKPTTSTMAVALILAAVAGAVAVGMASASSDRSGQSGTLSAASNLENTCTIAAQVSYQSVTLDQAVAAGPRALNAKTNALAAEPGSSAVEEAAGLAHSQSWPMVDGRNVVLVRLVNVAPVPIFGPPKPGPMLMSTPSCVIAVYDADTGDKIVEWQTLPIP